MLRIIFAIVLLVQAAGYVNLSATSEPIPECFPCPEAVR